MPKMDESVAQAIREMDEQEGGLALTDETVVTLNGFHWTLAEYTDSLVEAIESGAVVETDLIPARVLENESQEREITHDEIPDFLALVRREWVPPMLDELKARGYYFSEIVVDEESNVRSQLVARSRRQVFRQLAPEELKSTKPKKRPKKTHGKRK